MSRTKFSLEQVTAVSKMQPEDLANWVRERNWEEFLNGDWYADIIEIYGKVENSCGQRDYLIWKAGYEAAFEPHTCE